MPQSSSFRVPSYRRHRSTGQAVVTIDGRDTYLGTWKSAASRVAYDRVIAEWIAHGRQLPLASTVTVAELLVGFLRYAESYYVRRDGTPTSELHILKMAMRPLRKLYGTLSAGEFTPLKLKAVRQLMIDGGLARSTINKLIVRVRMIFAWGVENEIVSGGVLHALQALKPLLYGRSEAAETDPVPPVEDSLVEATLPHLPEIVQAMVRLQRASGMRPGEVCIVRPCDVDTSGEIWLYKPHRHKTEHHGRSRVIYLGPTAQSILRPFLLREKTTYCFVPAESERKRLANRHEARITPLGYGNRPGTNRAHKPRRRAGDVYIESAYCRAIRRACERLAGLKRPRRPKIASELPRYREELEAFNERLSQVSWSPNQLRHAAGTAIRKRFGLESAQVALGHAHADVTQIYAERNDELGRLVAREVG